MEMMLSVNVQMNSEARSGMVHREMQAGAQQCEKLNDH